MHLQRFQDDSERPRGYSRLPLWVVTAGVNRYRDPAALRQYRPWRMSVSYVSTGGMIVEQNGCTYAVNAGQVLIGSFGVDRVVRAGPEGFWHSRYITLSGDAAEHISAILGLTDRVVVDCTDPTAVAGYLKGIIATMAGQALGFEERASMQAYGLLMELARQETHAPPPEMRTLLRYIEDNLHRGITVSELASTIHTSEVTLNRLFNTYLGIPPIAYHLRKRFQAACGMLRNSAMPIKRIAATLGFDDPNYFTARFTKYYGVSPRRYRDDGRTGHGASSQRR